MDVPRTWALPSTPPRRSTTLQTRNLLTGLTRQLSQIPRPRSQMVTFLYACVYVLLIWIDEATIDGCGAKRQNEACLYSCVQTHMVCLWHMKPIDALNSTLWWMRHNQCPDAQLTNVHLIFTTFYTHIYTHTHTDWDENAPEFIEDKDAVKPSAWVPSYTCTHVYTYMYTCIEHLREHYLDSIR